MQTVILLNILVVTISFFARFKQTKYALEVSFLIIFLFTALRFNFGTDYQSYLKLFSSIHSYSSIFSLNVEFENIEKGWLILCFIFKPIGFFGMIFVLSAFICYTYYSIIKKYVAVNYYWFAIFIYVFTFEIMMIQFSAIRQALAIAIFINSTKYLTEEKKPIKYLIMILFAGLIHTSAFIMFPFVFLSLKKNQNINIMGYIILIVFFILLFFGNIILQYFPLLITLTTGARYLSTFNVETMGASTLVGIIFWSLLSLITFYYSLKQPNHIKILFYFVLFYFIVYTLINLIWLVNRIGFYFVPFTIIVYPLILQN